MNRTKVKDYAPQARREFIQAMTDRAVFYGLTPKKIEPVVERGDVAVIAGREHFRTVVKKRKTLEDRITRHGFEQTMEALAYTWFNRLVAIRFMELHGYLGHGYRVLSHPEGKPTPEILQHAEHVELPGLKKEAVIELKLAGNKETELYRLLLTSQCNALNTAMPFLFEKIDDETELLLPDSLLHSDSLIRKLVSEIDEEDWQEVEIIGWLYQFYISEKKDEVIGKVVASEDIPAATQLFTPNWIVKFLVQNTLGRQWFGDPGCFGGPITMPAFERLAKGGLRYTNMHTAPVCSPTRVALLTGRNSHSANMGGVAEMGTAFPGMNCVRPQSVAPLAEILRLNGYGTAMFGKSHELPPWELSVSGPLDRWPAHSGFDKFYGFLQGESDLYSPALYDGVTRIPTPRNPDYHVSTDITDKAIIWVRSQQSLMPDKPFFIYYAAAGTHDPHHVPKEWIDKYKSKFDQGWDQLREETLARQIKLGTVPPDTKLAPMPAMASPWSSFTPEEQRVLAREMEVYAAMAEHTDYEIGRLVQAIEDLGELDNTLVVWVAGDNGGSPFGGPIGSFNQLALFNGVPETMENLLQHIDDLGGPKASGHYAMPWGQASCTPMVGGQGHATFSSTRNATVIHWPKWIKAKGEIRTQFQHVIDLAPTVLEAAGLPEPTVVNGMTQKPMEGGSLLHTFNDAKAKSRHATQYFEYGGNRAIYHDGWYATTLHKAFWEAAPRATFENDTWELYKTEDDFSLANDLAATYPDKVEALKALFLTEAVKYNVLPLDDRVLERFNASIAGRPDLMGPRTSLTLYEGMIGLSENAFINMKNRSYTITAELEIPKGGAEGVIIAQGGHTGGWSLYVHKGQPKFAYNWFGRELYEVSAPKVLPAGAVTLRWEFIYDGGKMPGAGGRGDVFVNGEQMASGRINRTIPFFTGTETADVGLDDLTPVTHDYKAYDNTFTGTIRKIVIGVGPVGEAFDPPLEWNGVG